jgi:S1-C subfamily serine protease
MDYARLLRLAGFVLRPRRPRMPSFGSTSLPPTGDGLRVVSQPPLGSPLYLAGLGEGDEITSVNGRSVAGFDALDRAIGRVAPGATVSVRFARRGERQEQSAAVTVIADPTLEIVPVEKTGGTLSEAQRVVRESWIAAR